MYKATLSRSENLRENKKTFNCLSTLCFEYSLLCKQNFLNNHFTTFIRFLCVFAFNGNTVFHRMFLLGLASHITGLVECIEWLTQVVC